MHLHSKQRGFYSELTETIAGATAGFRFSFLFHYRKNLGNTAIKNAALRAAFLMAAENANGGLKKALYQIGHFIFNFINLTGSEGPVVLPAVVVLLYMFG